MGQREYVFDNAKGILIFFVVFGHMLEGNLSGITEKMYIMIYCFHMPLFVIISGYFAEFDGKKIAKNLILPYVCFQILFSYASNWEGQGDVQKIQLTTPVWILWYLVALAVWKITIPFIKTENIRSRMLIFAGAVILALLIGHDDTVGYYMSLSRMIVFFPYFLIGYYGKNAKKRNARTYRLYANLRKEWCFILLVGILMGICCFSEKIDYRWLYGAYSYSAVGYGPLHRAFLYLVGIALSLLLLKMIPHGKSLFSGIGSRSMQVYLGHVFVVAAVRQFLPEEVGFSECEWLALATIGSLLMVWVLSAPQLNLKKFVRDLCFEMWDNCPMINMRVHRTGER